MFWFCKKRSLVSNLARATESDRVFANLLDVGQLLDRGVQTLLDDCDLLILLVAKMLQIGVRVVKLREELVHVRLLGLAQRSEYVDHRH